MCTVELPLEPQAVPSRQEDDMLAVCSALRMSLGSGELALELLDMALQLSNLILGGLDV